ncbi:hypothetical protein [Ruania halotolerans]|uniref:hypothetical protein n=1 Tax=Ruania halotolerans TaxID=2897773 RepID=UPI001E6150C3|nr:hypothetical protein [Ruania halotolerans]UFU07948.1 hypothetical protein LQF10_07580 [Ruania halotolerans]
MTEVRRFREIRMCAHSAWRSTAFGLDADAPDEPAFCVPQGCADHHIAGLCNTNSYIETIDDFLASATWCDLIALPDLEPDSEEAEGLFRWHSMMLLVAGELMEDLRLIVEGAGESSDWLDVGDLRDLRGLINNLWKHRDGPRDTSKRVTRAVVHRDLHHGPYFFPYSYPDGLDELEPRLYGMHNPRIDPCSIEGVLIPSIVEIAHLLGQAVARACKVLDDPENLNVLQKHWPEMEAAK